MTDQEKIEKVQQGFDLRSRKKAIAHVYFIDWMTENNANLEYLLKQYKKDTGDKTIEFMEFCEVMYSQCKKNYLRRRKNENRLII